MRQESVRWTRNTAVSEKPAIINVIIADHQPVFRAGIAKLLAIEDDVRIIAQPLSPDHLLNALENLRPHVLILSSGFLPEPEQIGKITALASERQIAILVLTDNPEAAPQFIPWGVQGVFRRSVKADALIDGVRQLSRGGRFLQMHASAEMCTDLVGERVSSKLSVRELKVIAAVVRGYRNSEIAAQLGTTVPLLKKILRTIFDTTGVSGRLELALFVVHHQALAHAAAEHHFDLPALPALPLSRKQKFRVAAAAMNSTFPDKASSLPQPPKLV